MAQEGAVTRFFRATEIDTRMLGMVAALLVIWVGFDIYSGMLRPNVGLFGGSFLTPRNLWTLLVQTSSIAIMSTGMVLLIVMRQLDLSVGSMLSTIAVATGVLQVFELGPWLGVGHESIWIIAVLFAIALGAFMGWFNGMLTAYAGIPAFIVTLGGLIAYSGIAWALIRGETVAPMDKTFKLIGGNGPLASIGPFWSWVVAAIACAGLVFGLLNGTAATQALQISVQRPVWAEVLLAVCGGAAILGDDGGRQLLPLGAESHRDLREGQRHSDSRRSGGKGRRRDLHGRRRGRPLRRRAWSSIPAMPSRCSSRSRSASR